MSGLFFDRALYIAEVAKFPPMLLGLLTNPLGKGLQLGFLMKKLLDQLALSRVEEEEEEEKGEKLFRSVIYTIATK